MLLLLSYGPLATPLQTAAAATAGDGATREAQLKAQVEKVRKARVTQDQREIAAAMATSTTLAATCPRSTLTADSMSEDGNAG